MKKSLVIKKYARKTIFFIHLELLATYAIVPNPYVLATK